MVHYTVVYSIEMVTWYIDYCTFFRLLCHSLKRICLISGHRYLGQYLAIWFCVLLLSFMACHYEEKSFDNVKTRVYDLVTWHDSRANRAAEIIDNRDSLWKSTLSSCYFQLFTGGVYRKLIRIRGVAVLKPKPMMMVWSRRLEKAIAYWLNVNMLHGLSLRSEMAYTVSGRKESVWVCRSFHVAWFITFDLPKVLTIWLFRWIQLGRKTLFDGAEGYLGRSLDTGSCYFYSS